MWLNLLLIKEVYKKTSNTYNKKMVNQMKDKSN
jgi:hypothetical protein